MHYGRWCSGSTSRARNLNHSCLGQGFVHMYLRITFTGCYLRIDKQILIIHNLQLTDIIACHIAMLRECCQRTPVAL